MKEFEVNKVYEGDCLEIMPAIPDNSIDMVLCDLPYGTTQNGWDGIIDLPSLWQEYKRILKGSGVVALTSQGLFTASLIMSNTAMFKYKIAWIKSFPTNFLNAKKQPLRRHEDICIFYAKQPVYHPQMQKGRPRYDKGSNDDKQTGSYGVFEPKRKQNFNGMRYPTDALFIPDEHEEDWVSFKNAWTEGKAFHPNQKPVALGRYLIRTYTNPGEVVLDNACGSGSFLVAAVLEGRNYVGIELNRHSFRLKTHAVDFIEVCRQRIEVAKNQWQTNANKLSLF